MKTLRILLTLLLTAAFSSESLAQSIWDGTTVATSFQSGTGTAEDPYLIYTPEQWAYFCQQVSSGKQFSLDHVKLMSDINLGGHDVHANGTFDGYLDGGNHWIKGYCCEVGYSVASTHAYGCLILEVSGVVHNLAIVGSTRGSYNTFSYARMAIANTLSETGHIYNCVYSIYCGAYAGSAGTMAFQNYGRIENCYTYGTYSTVFDGTDAKSFGTICYENMKTGSIYNCKYSFNKASYGGVFAEVSLSYNYTDRKNAGIIETFIGDEWVASHTDYDYSNWSGEYGLTCFDPTIASQCTVTFIDEMKLSSTPSFNVEKGSAIGELPTPTSEKTFIGWYRNNTLVMPTDVVDSDWTLFAKWQNCVRQQPSVASPTFIVDDSKKASFQWYEKHENMQYGDWDSGTTYNDQTSKQTFTLNVTEGMSLTFNWKVSSEQDYDFMSVSINGTNVLKKSGNDSGTFSYTFTENGEYTVVFAYTKDGSDWSGSDKAWFTNIAVGFSDAKLTDACTATLPEKYTVLNGDYYCIATYSDGSNKLISDVVSIIVTPCAPPSIIFANNKLSFECATPDANIHWSIEAPAVQLQGTGAIPGKAVNEALENATLTISAYATAQGYGRSETSIRTFNVNNFYDVNGDGKVNIADVTIIVSAILSQSND